MRIYTITTDEFAARHRAEYLSVFTGMPFEDGIFRDKSWKCILIPGPLNLDETELAAWFHMMSVAKDTQLVITDVQGPIPHEYSVKILDPDMDLSGCLLEDTPLPHLICASFGPSMLWGIYFDLEFACIGGAPEVADAFAREAGGYDFLRTTFQEYVNNRWSEYSDPSNFYRWQRIFRLYGI